MKYFAFVISSIYSISFQFSLAQSVNLSYEEANNEILVKVYNPQYCAVSVSLEYTLDNIKTKSGSLSALVVVPALSEIIVEKLESINPRQKGSYHTKYKTSYGDVRQIEYDEDYVYSLPFEMGQTYTIHQGYFGKYSHSNVRALDFNMPKGSKVCAARGGVVVRVIESNSQGCNSPSCHQFNNVVVIYHEDGTLAVYSHLDHNGVIVEEGDLVVKGQHIAYSGDTGYVSGPHLHFMVFVPRFEGDNISISTYFSSNRSKKSYLYEKWDYSRVTTSM